MGRWFYGVQVSFFINSELWSNPLFFRPERWTSIPGVAKSVPGVWANLMTFVGGPRSCIGFRFSLLEWVLRFYYVCWISSPKGFYCVNDRMKVLLFTLVRAFEFDLAVSPKDVGTASFAIQRPILLTDPKRSNQMPLLVRPISNLWSHFWMCRRSSAIYNIYHWSIVRMHKCARFKFSCQSENLPTFLTLLHSL